MRFLLALIFVFAAWSQAQPKPSRPPASGCKWVPWQDDELGIRVLVQQCEGSSARKLVASGYSVRIVAAGRDPEQSPIAFEVYEKPDRQRLKDAVDRKFFGKLSSRAKAGCEFVEVTDKFSLAGDNEAWQIAPAAVFRGEAAKMREADPGAEVCGPYGEIDVPRYFEYHPSESKARYLFVRLGPEARIFDEKSIQILIR